jgi:hypothetical protein
MKITDVQLRRIIHEELYHGSLINLGSSQGRRTFRGDPCLFERSYITGVLGVHIPLNESYPYSHRLNEEILREQFLFEGFWGELLQKGKDKLLDAKEGIKKFGKEAWAILAAFYEVIKGGAGDISSFTGSIAKKGINKFFKKIRETLKWMVAKLPEWDMPTFSDWAQKGLDALDAIQENVNGLDGWKRVIGFAGLAVGLQWLWQKVGGWIEEFKEKVGELDPREKIKEEILGPIKEWIKETAMEKLKEVGGDVFKKIMTTLASVTSGVKPWWDAAVKVAGGAKLVIDALGAAASRFMTRKSATFGSTSEGRMMKVTKRQLRRIIREAITTVSDEDFDRITMPGYKGPQPAPGSLEHSINKKPWSGGPNEIMTISSGDVAWESHALGTKTHRRGDVFVDSLPGGVTIKDASEEYTLKKGTVVSPKWQSFTGQDKDGVRVTVTPRTDWK